jgi:hypothetical protein
MPFRLNGAVYQDGASIPRGTFVSDERAAQLANEGHAPKLVSLAHDEDICPMIDPSCGDDCTYNPPQKQSPQISIRIPNPLGIPVAAEAK